MAHSKGTTDEDIGRPGPWREGRYQQGGQPLDQSVRTAPGTLPNPHTRASTPVTRKDYEFPGEEAHKDGGGGSVEPPGGDAG
jgi:hypothetical protein